MKIEILQSVSTQTVIVATNNPLKLFASKAGKFKPIAQFDEFHPSRAKWIPDKQVDEVRELIKRQGYTCLCEGNISAVLPEPFGFFPSESQEVISAYWGLMTKVGQLGEGCSAFFVRFHDKIPHGYHSHPKHSEIVFVVAGEIDQTIGYEKKVLKAGDSAVIPIGMRHRAEPLIPGTEVLVVLFGDGTDYLNVELE